MIRIPGMRILLQYEAHIQGVNMKVLPVGILILFLVGLGIGTVGAVTETFYADTNADGRITNTTTQTYYSTRLGDGNAILITTSLVNLACIEFTATPLQTDMLGRFGWSANTSAIPDDATITGATFSLEGETGSYNEAGNLSFGITGFTPANPAVIATGDFDTVGSVLYSDTYINYADWKIGKNNYPLNAAGLANISKTGYTSIIFRIKDDILNTTSEITDNTTAYSSVKGYDSSAGGAFRPNLTVTYTVPGGGGTNVTFTSNSSVTNVPRAGIIFNDTSTISSPTGRKWEYKDYSGYTTNGYTKTPNPVWNIFSNTNTATPSYAWGAGNWSIKLTVTNASGSYVSTDYYYWVNVSAGSLGGTIPGTYRMYPSDNIWNVPKDTLPIDSHSAAWLAGLNALSAYDRIGYYISSTGVQGMTINTSNTSRQSISGSRSYWNDFNPIPLPDNFIVESASWDRHGFIVDTVNGFSYEMYAMEKNVNGTWEGDPSIWNTSNHLYRFYPNTFLGENYYYTYPYSGNPSGTIRVNQTNMWAGGVSGQPQSAGMVRYEEVATGYINHSLFLNVVYMNGTAIWPAVSSGDWGDSSKPGYLSGSPPAGAIIRLNSSYNINGMSPQSKVIAQALKTYGGIISENNWGSACTYPSKPCGNSMNVIGYYSPSWNSTQLGELLLISSSNFEFVNAESLIPTSTSCVNSGISGYHICYSMQTNVGITDQPPTFTKSKTVIRIPASVTFTDTTQGTVSAWNWSFGNGVYSTSQSPTYQYKKPGRYTVSLTTAGGVAYSTVTVIRGGGGEQMLTPFQQRNPLMVNMDDYTYTTSRDLTEQERIMTEEKLFGGGYEL